jgi:hypothetical protein
MIAPPEFGYRDDSGVISRKFTTAKSAILYWMHKEYRGTPCRLINGRWRKFDFAVIRHDTLRRTAMHMLRRQIKLGYCDAGTDAVIEGSSVFGSFWWPIVRDAVLERDGYGCQLCGSTKTDELHVHHILPRHRGGSDHPVNLVVVCIPCHKMIHRARENESFSNHKKQTRLELQG